MKRKNHFDAPENSKSCEYSIAEISEEDSNDDDPCKSHPFLLQALHSPVADGTENTFKKASAFPHYFSHTSSGRYLLFQVFRI